MPVKLTANAYGKSDVRLTKVVRKGPWHELFEFSVDVQLSGDFEPSYTDGDNAPIVATDSIKNTVYVLAKEREFDTAEAYAALLADHFVGTYPQVISAHVEVRQTAWARIDVAGRPHDHAFANAGRDLHTATALASRGRPTAVGGGVTDLLVLKSGNSAFKGFVTDRYRTLPDTDDRIFATSVTATWEYTPGEPVDYAATYAAARSAVLTTFATHVSLAVQQTMFEMGKAVLAAVPQARAVHLRLPNKHRIPVDLSRFGLKNGNDVFVWTDEPYGDITATVEREGD